MRVSVVRGGGVAGMVRVSEIDADALSDADRRTLEDLLDRSGMAAAAGAPAPSPAHADEMAYEIRVHEGAEPVVARFRESTLPDGARALMAWIAQRPETRSRLDRPPR
ncbi:MAG: protealysin inhibitor emfourin [Solirubrobacteraceae bacterium]